MRAGDALSAYLWLVTESNRAVGWLQGAVGVAQLAAALPAGWAADHPRCRRDTVLKAAAALGFLSALAFGAALVFNRSNMAELFVAVALLGAWKGAATPPFESIFADSVATGASAPYTAKYALSMVAAAAGPLLSCLLFKAMGDAWSAGSCRAVLLAGLAAMLPPLAVACAFDDDASLGRRSEARDSASMTPATSVASGLSRMRSGASLSTATTTATTTAVASPQEQQQRRRRQQRRARGGSARRRRSRGGDVLGGSSDDGGGNEGDDIGGDETAALHGDSDDDLRRIAAGNFSAPPSALASPAPASLSALSPPPANVPNSSLGFDPSALSSSLERQQQLQQLRQQLQQPEVRILSPSTWPLGAVVAALITLSDLIGALASGMTLKFFSLFFLQACDLGPVAVSLVGTAAPLGVAAASMLAGRVARRHGGRLHLSLLTRTVDVGLLVLLSRLPTNRGRLSDSGSSSSSDLSTSSSASAAASRVPMTTAATAAVIAVHLLRMATANATRPLVRAMLMENVPKRHRGKVNALDSVRTFSWSGSAALGGELIARYGFGATFVVTAGVKVAAMLPLVPLIFLLPEEGRLRFGAWSFGGGGGGGGASNATANRGGGGGGGSGYSSSFGTGNSSGGGSDEFGGGVVGGLSTDDDDGGESRRLLIAAAVKSNTTPSRVRSAGGGNGSRRRAGGSSRPGSAGGFGRRGAAEGSQEQTLLPSSTDEEAPPPARRASSEAQREAWQQQNRNDQNQQQQQRHHPRPARNDSTFSLRL